MSYVDGFVLVVPTARMDEYAAMASKAGALWIEHGALGFEECVGDDLAGNGFCATFPDLVDLKEGETVVFSFITFADRAARDAVNAKVMADPRLQEICPGDNPPFDCKRMSYGGFKSLVSYQRPSTVTG